MCYADHAYIHVIIKYEKVSFDYAPVGRGDGIDVCRRYRSGNGLGSSMRDHLLLM